jgi:DNA-binding GntR family transcriptional regulator
MLETATELPGGTRPAKSSVLVENLREAILSGALKPGENINLDRVRRDSDVSLGPLRET